jgi:hypothetical protein
LAITIVKRKENSATNDLLEEGMLMALEQELATYKAKLPDLKEQQGKFVLIHGDEVVDFYVAYEDAIKAGY